MLPENKLILSSASVASVLTRAKDVSRAKDDIFHGDAVNSDII